MRRLLTSLLLLSAVSASAAVTGTVVSDDGAPLAGARIRAFAREPFSAIAARLLSDAPEAVPVATSESAADGRFSVDVKGNATVDVVVDATGRQAAAFFAADGDDAGAVALRPAAKARRLRVTADGKPVPNALVYLGHSLLVRSDAEGKFPYEPTGESLFVIHPDYAISSTIERNSEVPLHRNAAVRGRVVARDGTTPVAGAVVSAGGWPLARSGADGTFTIAHPPAKLRAILAVSGTDAGAAAVAAAKPVEIRLGTAASLSGSVTGKGQTPVAGAAVRITNDGENYSAVTDAKGRYAIPALPPAGYQALATHPGYAAVRVADLAVTPSATHSFALPARARVRGTVLTDDRKPAAGAFVAVGAGGIGNSVVMTTPAGEFTLRPAVSGPLFLAASKSGYATAVSPPLTVEPGETKSGVTLTLQRGFPLQIKVIDPDRQPVANAAVDISLTNENARTVPMPCSLVDRAQCRLTGADGTIETRLAEGKYEIRVSGDFIPKTLADQHLTARSSPFLITVVRGADVSGRVAFADGTPVADARVSVAGGSFIAVSDANGAFTIKQLPRVPESVVAVTQEEPPLRSEPVKVTPPARDVTLTIPTPARIEGRVVDRATSQPVTSFNVSVSARAQSFGGRGLDITSDDGSFVLKRVQPGSLTLHVTAPGYVAGSVSDLLLEEGKALTGVEVKLDRGGRVVGHVTAGGSPAAGVSVRYGGRTARRVPMPAMTDANGDYTLDGVPAGEETIDFMKQGFVTKRKSVDLAAGKEVRVDVDLDRGREIRGRVVDKSGQPVAGARIAASTTSAPFAASAQSGDDGQFTISGLEDAHYNISAQKNGYVSASVDDVDPAAGRQVTLTLDRGATITGRVVGLAAEELSQVRVSASARNAGASAQTDAGGNFTLTGIPDGSVTLTAYKQAPPARQSAPKTIEVSNGNAPPVEIDFNAGISIRGRVTRNALPVSGGSVMFAPRSRGAQHSAQAMIGADGSYEINGVDAGDYEVRVTTMGGGNDSVPYTVTGNATFDIDLKGAAVRGVAVDAATGVPLPDVRIFATPASPSTRVWRNAVSDSDGRFVLDLLPDGAFNVRAEREHYGVTTQSLTVSGGTSPPLELRLTRGQEAVIRIVDADSGAPLDGSVGLFDAQKKYVANGSGRGEDGATHVWAAPGRYTAQVRVNGYMPQSVDVMVPGPEVRAPMTRAANLMITSRTGGKFRIVPPGGAGAAPVGGARVTTAINVAAGERVPVNSLAPGVYEVDKLTPDLKSIAKSYTVVLTGGQTATLDAD